MPTKRVNDHLNQLFSLENKIILLTGAAGGIGSELAKGLAAVGGTLCLCDYNMDGLHVVKKEICEAGDSADVFEINMTDINSIKKCVSDIIAKHHKIDVLINCAGVNKRVGQLDADEETFDKIVNVNLKGVFFLSQEVGRHMVEQKNGSVINIGSYNAFMMLGGNGIYGATKSGVLALTRSQAIEWAKHGIRSNAICPGHISTPLTAPLWTDPERSKFMLDRIAMNRPGVPQDLLGITILLASDASNYMSGMYYHVDGGCLAGGQPWKYDTNY